MNYFWLFLTAVLLLSGCKKENLDPDGLVPATQSGKNTGGFLLNGQPFNPQPRVSAPGDKAVGASWGRSSSGSRNVQLSFFRQERDDNRTEHLFDVFIANIRSTGTYGLLDSVNPFVVPGARTFGIYTAPGIPPAIRRYYLTGPTAIGRVDVTRYDTVAHVISGTFEAKLREYQGPDSLGITKGRFDCTF
jgi:hypothetical protein